GGTTGVPKGAMLTHYNLYAAAIQTARPTACIESLPRTNCNGSASRPSALRSFLPYRRERRRLLRRRSRRETTEARRRLRSIPKRTTRRLTPVSSLNPPRLLRGSLRLHFRAAFAVERR